MAGSESAIWEDCAARAVPGPLGGTLTRVVESQEQIATTRLVDGDLARQDALERLLEERSKPPRRPGTERFDYLLAAPWRYPPLRYGSRFGRPFEPSLFYGSRSVDTALAETAYYRFVLLDDMARPPARVVTQHTSFEARYRGERGLRLQAPPFDAFARELAHPADYRACQALGTALREAEIDAFEFRSARDPDGGVNVALLEPAALASNRHLRPREWSCVSARDEVAFRTRARPSRLVRHARETFEVDGVLPRPA